LIDTDKLVRQLHTLESVAVIPRVSSTNLIARRIVEECINNELSLPQAMIIAGEQFAGRGRNQRTWSSPPGKGIYATTLLTRPARDVAIVPLAVAAIIAGYLAETFGIDARIKWPNDVVAGGRKIAGTLIEARTHDELAYMLIGIGVNVEPFKDDSRPNATSIREAARRDFTGIEDATVRFVRYVDARLSTDLRREDVLAEWRHLAIHRVGEPITCVIGNRTVSGTWEGIDDFGRALLRHGRETMAISAGELVG
jgi:BirA family biotin operon repressor/biotin-[acetyl-CoA-carboxylase] ligase